MDLTGEESLIEDGLEFIQSLNVDINLTMNSLSWDKDRCTGCGNCVPHCPTGALHVKDNRSRQIAFSRDKCIECVITSYSIHYTKLYDVQPDQKTGGCNFRIFSGHRPIACQFPPAQQDYCRSVLRYGCGGSA